LVVLTSAFVALANLRAHAPVNALYGKDTSLAMLRWQRSGLREGFFSVRIDANDGQTRWKLHDGAVTVADRRESASLNRQDKWKNVAQLLDTT